MEQKIEMKKYFIKWNAGYGENYEIIIVKNMKQANESAYMACLEEAENNMDYSAEPLTDEVIEEYGLNEEE